MPTDAARGIELPGLEKALKGGGIAACLLSSSFNNPLGCTMPDEKKLAVLDMLARRRVPLIEDDICAPGDVFSASGRHAHCLRLSGGHPWDARIEKGLLTLAQMTRSALARAAAARGG